MNDRDLPLPLDDPLPTEPQVASFLREHPEFLTRHPALLAEMRVPHQASGSARPLPGSIVVCGRALNVLSLRAATDRLPTVVISIHQACTHLHHFRYLYLRAKESGHHINV